MNERIRVRETTDITPYVELPHRIYDGDAAWVPPLDAVLRRRLAPTNAFFRDAEIRRFVAERDGELVGTISALRDRRHEALKKEKVAFFGFFECVDDVEVAAELVGAASRQARLWEAEVLRGPRNLTRIEEVGCTTEGHDLPPPMLAGHHPRYYQRLLEGLGFVKHHDVLAYAVDLVDANGTPRPLTDALEKRAASVSIDGLVVRPAELLHLGRDLGIAHAVFVEAFRDVPENTPMPREQFVQIGRLLLAFTNRRMLQLATVAGKPAGFALCFPEMNEAIRAARGRVWPLGWARVLAAVRKIRTASFKLIGVMPEYRGSGLHALMIKHAIEGVRDAGYQRLEASLIDERNEPSRRVVEGGGMIPYRRYRIYDRPL